MPVQPDERDIEVAEDELLDSRKRKYEEPVAKDSKSPKKEKNRKTSRMPPARRQSIEQLKEEQGTFSPHMDRLLTHYKRWL